MKITSKLDNFLQWSATFLTILGALFTSANIYPLNVVAFNIGSILWLAFAVRINAPSLITVNAILLLIYAAGMAKVI